MTDNNNIIKINSNKSDNDNHFLLPEDLSDHFIMCNWTSKSAAIVRQLHDLSLPEKDFRDIVVITANKQDVVNTKGVLQQKEFQKLYVLEGDCKNKDILKLAHAKKAKTIIVLAEEGNSKVADANSILITLTLDKECPEVHTVVEILNSNNKEYFKHTKADEIICLEDLGERLIAQSALTPGLSNVFMDLMSQSDTSEVYQVEVNDKMIGMTYHELEEKIINNGNLDLILIGIIPADKKVPIINPKKSKGEIRRDYKIKQNDKLILIAYDNLTADELI